VNIRIGAHARRQARIRGVSIDEIEETVREAVQRKTYTLNRHHGRLDAKKVFDFGGEWRGERRERKLVWVVFVFDGDDVDVVTVIARYGRWDDAN
jgi:hypothetical protein